MEKKSTTGLLGFFKNLANKFSSIFSRVTKTKLSEDVISERHELSGARGLKIIADELKYKEFKEAKKAKKKRARKRKSTKKTVEELKKTIVELREKMKSLELDLTNKKIGEEEFKRKMTETQLLLKQVEQNTAMRNCGQEQRSLPERIKEKVDGPRLERIEQKLDNLMDTHNVSKEEIQQHTEQIDVNKVLKSIDNLASMVEIEKKSKQIEKLPVIVDPEHFGHKKNKEEIKTIAMDIKKHKIITGLDKVLSLVQEKNKISYNDAKVTGITKKEFVEFAEILKQEGLVELSYSPIGSLYLKYIEPAEEE